MIKVTLLLLNTPKIFRRTDHMWKECTGNVVSRSVLVVVARVTVPGILVRDSSCVSNRYVRVVMVTAM